MENGRALAKGGITTGGTSGETQVSRVALITGRPLYWDTRADHSDEQADKLDKLLKWCLELPNVRLGIDPEGLGLISPPSDTSGSYDWLESDEARRWTEAAIESLKIYIKNSPYAKSPVATRPLNRIQLRAPWIKTSSNSTPTTC